MTTQETIAIPFPTQHRKGGSLEESVTIVQSHCAPIARTARAIEQNTTGIVQRKRGLLARLLRNSTLFPYELKTISHAVEDGRYCASNPFATLAENSTDVIVRFDRECRALYVNKAFSELVGKAKNELLGKHINAAMCESHAEMLYKALTMVIANGKPHTFEYNCVTRDSRQIANEYRLIPEFDSNGEVFTVLGIGRNNLEANEEEQWLNQTESVAHIGHWQWEVVSGDVSLSAEACRMFGEARPWKPTIDEISHRIVEADRPLFFEAFRGALNRKDAELIFPCCVECNSSIIHLRITARFQYTPDGRLLRLAGTVQDTSELKRYEYRIHQLVFYDDLTGLPNRALFRDRLTQSLADAERRSHLLGLLIVGPNGLRTINDIHGHEVGDRLLKAFAERLSSLIDSYDTLARVEGDEFAILIPEVPEATSLGVVTRKIHEALAAPFYLDAGEYFISTCIGIAAFPLDGRTAIEMLQHADSALHEAKANGRAGFRFYSPDLTASSKRRATLERALRVAEQNGELDLYYQPKIDLIDGRLVGAEALLRWNHPTLGMISPDEFIRIAEDTGLISSIGAWVLSTACLAANRWNRHEGREFKVAVNLSSLQFGNTDLVELVCSILSLTNCEPRWLEFEITESLLLDDNRDVRATLEFFKSMGISLAIDDFGTGYSSLAYLKRFPIDVLKIDRSFIKDLTLDGDSTELVKAIITMARSLRLGLVAEGVESRAQEQVLQGSGCQIGQGYLYSKPLPRGEFEARFMSAENPDTYLHVQFIQ